MKICFTGNRPNKLGGYDWLNEKNMKIMLEIFRKVENIIKQNSSEEFHFICGGALGVDQMAFHICNKLKNKYDNKITLELAIPFKNQYIKWRFEDIKRYNLHKKQADIVTYVDEIPEYNKYNLNAGIYDIRKMQLRNMYMVDNSDIVIAVWDGTRGGTKSCVDYTRKQNKDIINIDTKEI